ncbi:MAG TPA: sulfatase-like hydrolase/transferase [Telluria sp.]|jgi:phosphoglycerol transferase
MNRPHHFQTSVVEQISRYTLYLSAYLLLCLSYWLNRYFGVPDIDQILYHLDFGMQGLVATDPVLLKRFVRWCVIAPVLLLILTFCFERSRTAVPVLRRRPVRLALPAVLLLGAVLHWMIQIAALNHVLARYGPDYFGTHYIAPQTVPIHARAPKNLVLIYVESLEAGYRSESALGTNLLAPLDALGGVRFPAFRQAPGTGWTIAGLVATQCALPLKRVTLFDENTQGEAVASFLPNASCLADILAQSGYRNVFMGGASPTFAGKGKFLRSHGYHEIYGKEDWLAAGAGKNEMNGWGLYDGGLFARARRKLDALQASGAHFNLTLLTVNTHEPNGHLSGDCARRGYHGFSGVIGCSAADLAAFVQYIKHSGYFVNTNVVILGDHLARKNPLTDKLDTLPERTIYNLFLSADAAQATSAEIVHFDLLPSILTLSGFDIEGGRLGLGYSAFDRRVHAPQARFSEMQNALMNRSDIYLDLWAPTRPVHGRGQPASAASSASLKPASRLASILNGPLSTGAL